MATVALYGVEDRGSTPIREDEEHSCCFLYYHLPQMFKEQALGVRTNSFEGRPSHPLLY